MRFGEQADYGPEKTYLNFQSDMEYILYFTVFIDSSV